MTTSNTIKASPMFWVARMNVLPVLFLYKEDTTMGKLMNASTAAAVSDMKLCEEALEIVEVDGGIADIIRGRAKEGYTFAAINKSYFNHPKHLSYILRVLNVHGYRWEISETDPDDYIIHWVDVYGDEDVDDYEDEEDEEV